MSRPRLSDRRCFGCPTSPQRHRLPCFTLIELLVVVAVTLVLAAMLLPALSQAVERARATSCMSNTRQQSLAVHLYSQDFGCYPLLNFRNNQVPAESNTNIRWWNLLLPYVGAEKSFICPTAPEVKPGRNMAYGYNYQFLGNSHLELGHPDRVVVDARIQATGETVAILDSAGIDVADVAAAGGTYVPYFHGFTVDPPFSNWAHLVPMPDEDNGWSWKGKRSHPGTRHQRAANVAFCDGHAERLSREQLMQNNARWNGTGKP